MRHTALTPTLSGSRRGRGSSVAVLASGGLDSDILIADLVKRDIPVQPIYIRQGLAWENVEVFWLKRFLRAIRRPALQPLQILTLPMGDVYGSHWSTGRGAVPGHRTPDSAVYLPGRNLILLVKAAVYCALHKIPAIALAPLSHNPFPDATPAFFKSWEKTLSQGLNHRIHIQTPYRRLTKEQVVRRGASYPLGLSFSCIAPVRRLHCGRCNKCAERRKAFRRVHLPDPTRYAKA